ncbi:DENN domain-containing protein 5B [Taenia solium]|eukprot:TsM_000882800 transcript=TsM_000882800 gene=TsM_000882800
MPPIADYFFIAGLNPEIQLQPYFPQIKPSVENPSHIVHFAYKCHILQHFPEHCRSFPFSDDSTALVVMPNGLRFFTETHPLLQKARGPFRHAFIITREDGQRVFGYALLFPEEVTHPAVKAAIRERQKALGLPLDSECRFFTMKAVGILSRWAFANGFFGWLEDLWSSVYREQMGELTIESFVYNLLFEAQLAEPGQCSVVSGPNCPHFFFRPSNYHGEDTVSCAVSSWLPVFEYPLVQLLQLFSSSNLIRLLTCAFLEHRIVLLSADYYRLMVVGEGLICLLQPFVWPHVYAPVLPATLTHFLDAPVPYIMGMRFQRPPMPPQPSASQLVSATSTPRGSLPSLPSFSSFGLASEANVCYLDIDQGAVHSTDVDLPTFPNSTELQHNIEAVLAIYQHHQLNNQNLNRSLDSNFAATSTLLSRSQSVSRNTSFDTLPRPLLKLASDALSTSTVIRRPQLDPDPSVMRRSASYRLIEQIAATNVVEVEGRLPNPLTDTAFASSTTSFDAPKSGSYPSEEYFSCMREIASEMVSRRELADYAELLKFNYALRDIFLNHLAEIFVDFETFVVAGHNSGDAVEDASGPGSSGLQAFDKVGFLSDCPETHMAFLSAFLETQMFATFLDTHVATLTVNQSRRCSKCGMLCGGGLPSTMSISQPLALPVSAFLARIRSLKSQAAVDHQRPATDRLLRKSMHHSTTHTPAVDRGRRRDRFVGNIPKSPLDGVQFCNVPSPHPLFSKINPSFSTLQRSRQPGHFRLLERSFLSKAPANWQCGNESPPPPPSSGIGIVPSPFLTEETAAAVTTRTDEEVVGKPSVTFQLGGGGGDEAPRTVLCEHCSTPQALPPPTLEQSLTTGPQSTASRTIQLRGRDGLTRLLTGPGSNGLETGSLSPSMAQAHWDFVDSLLEECKHRTKRMVIQKMGYEALHLGHNYQSVSEVEENTLVSGLCDLLERIWSHGIQRKHGASALWMHILAFVERNTCLSLSSLAMSAQTTTHSPGPTDRLPASPSTSRGPRKFDSLPRRFSTTTTPETVALASPVTARVRRSLWTPTRSRSITPAVSSSESPGPSRLHDNALVISVSSLLDAGGSSVTALLDDVEAVKSVASSAGYKLRTNIGLARAFVRLALEKKRLSAYLKLLLSDSVLLRELYSRHAFLRCEEEREQFLVHLLSLDAVDYFSFTRMLQKAEMLYRVAIVSGGGGRARLTLAFSANAWVCLRGHLGSSGHVPLPRASPSYVEFRHQNLGIINTLLIGHDNAGFSPNMFVETVLVATPLTNHVCLFPCGHWLGRGVEDNSCERLLIGQIARVGKEGTIVVPRSAGRTSVESEEVASSLATPLMRLYSDTILDPMTSAVLDRLANAVNRLAKHFACTSRVEATMSLSALLCSKEYGLAPALEAVFTHGIRSSGVFQRRRLYAWDFFERFVEHQNRGTSSDQAQTRPVEMERLDAAPVHIGGFDVSFVTSPRFVRTLPRNSGGSGGPRNLDNNPRRAPLPGKTNSRLLLRGAALPPVPASASTLSGGWQSQPCSPGMPLQRRQRSRSARSIFALDNFISTFRQVNLGGSHIGKLGKFQRMVCIGCQDHTIASWIPVLATTSPALVRQLYDTRIPNFLLDPDLRDSVQTLLSTLNDFTFKLDPALLGTCPESDISGPAE